MQRFTAVLFGCSLMLISPSNPTWSHPGIRLPEVSSGGNPYRSFPGDGEVRTVSIPSDQDFIVTLIDQYATLAIDGVTASHSAFAAGTPGAAALYTGRGKLRVPAGSELRTSGYVQGYFVQAGSPYRFASGEVTPSSSPTDFKPIFTADSDRDFVISTMAVRDYRSLTCDLYLDGSLYLRSNSYLMSPGYTDPFDFVGALTRGNGSMVVPAGATLQIVNVGTLPCFYYLDGQYIQP